MYFFINTALETTELALFNSERVLKYTKEKVKHESTLVMEFLKEVNLDDIKGILICSGPGRFTSLRSGIATAKTFAYVKNISLYPFYTHQYLSLLVDDSVQVLQQVGINEIFLNGEKTSFDQLKDNPQKWIGELKTPQQLPISWEKEGRPETKHQHFLNLLKQLEAKEDIEIYYGKKPVIFTKS